MLFLPPNGGIALNQGLQYFMSVRDPFTVVFQDRYPFDG